MSFLMSLRLNGLLSAKLVNYELSIELLIKLRSCVLIWLRFKLTCRMSFCKIESLNLIATCLFSSCLNFIKLFISSVKIVENWLPRPIFFLSKTLYLFYLRSLLYRQNSSRVMFVIVWCLSFLFLFGLISSILLIFSKIEFRILEDVSFLS